MLYEALMFGLPVMVSIQSMPYIGLQCQPFVTLTVWCGVLCPFASTAYGRPQTHAIAATARAGAEVHAITLSTRAGHERHVRRGHGTFTTLREIFNG